MFADRVFYVGNCGLGNKRKAFVNFVLISLENKIYRKYKEYKAYKVVQPECRIESKTRKEGKYNQCNYFLQYLKLYRRKRSAITFESDTIGRYLKAVFK